ncbi:MAG: AraC family transcriptional regulator [Alphaproteobacteria bacterium]|nr:AraC family transcriptional regulator [Alphaproteobacteria bacterium]
MGQITSLFVHKVTAQASAGVRTRDLVEGLGIDPDAPVDPSRMVASSDYYEFFAELAKRDPDGATLPLRTGASMRTNEYGAFGFAWKSAPNLHGSFVRAERYAQVLTNVTRYEIETTSDGVLFRLRRSGERQLGLRLSNEASIASVVAISDEVCTAPFAPDAVYFRHPAPGSIEAHVAHFGCPVIFASDKDAILVSGEALASPNRLGDAGISAFFDQHLQAELAALADDNGLEKQVKIAVAQTLSDGVPTVSLIAAKLGASGRTLQRRLSDKGLSFQILGPVDKVIDP